MNIELSRDTYARSHWFRIKLGDNADYSSSTNTDEKS